MYYKCSVPDCVSSRQNAILHKFPKCEKRLKKWLDFINCDALRMKPPTELRDLQVCHKHFEARFVTKKSRLLSIAYPTLFLKSEVLSGLPLNSPETCEKVHPVSEYVHPKKMHYDHNYSKRVLESHSQKKFVPTGVSSTSVVIAAVENNTSNVILQGYNQTTSTTAPVDVYKPFSWQNQCKAVPISADERGMEIIDIYDNLSMYCDDETTKPKATKDYVEGQNEGRHEGYQCNTCSDDIIGYRYTCVHCTDYDLCSACEASGVHPHHYVLRVPGPRPQEEIQAVLEKIRRDLNSYFKSAFSPSSDADVISVKSETKEEPEEFDDHYLIGETLITPDTKEYDDDPLSMRNTQTDYLEDAPSIRPSPCEKASYTIKNVTADKEGFKILEEKVVNKPNSEEETKPLARRVTINKCGLRKVASLLPNERLRLVVKRRTSRIDTTQPDKSKENSDYTFMRKENKLLP